MKNQDFSHSEFVLTSKFTVLLRMEDNMKKYIFKGLACLLVMALMTPAIFQYTAPTIAQAAKKERRVETKKEKQEDSKQGRKEGSKKVNKENKGKKAKQKASFALSKKTLDGIGVTYQIEVKNLSATTARTWYSTNDKVAKVDSNGLVTGVNYGTAVIKCVVGDKKKGTSVLSCVIKVKGKKAEVTITNKILKDDIQYMTIGSTYDFNATIKPEGTAGKISWSINDPSIATVNADGVVTAIKEGLAVLTATAVGDIASVVPASGSAVAASGSAITLTNVKSDKVVIRVTSGTTIEPVRVDTVTMGSDKTLVIKFTASMKPETLINSISSVLNSAITITPVANAYGVTAVNPGELKGVLTDNGKTLIVTATNYFYGYYDVKLTNQVISAAGAALKEYQKRTLLIYLQ